MEWTEIAPSLAVLGALIAIWWRLNGRIDTLDAKIDRLNALLTDNLIALRGGEGFRRSPSPLVG